MAQAPVAIVEQVESRSAGVEVMDYLEVGQVVRLQPDEKLVLGYLRSCLQEKISSGTVTIGAEQSDVTGGSLERGKVACDTTQATLTPDQLKKSGAMAFRAGPKKGKPGQPQVTIYGTSPVIEAKGAGKLTVERLDQPGEKLQVPIEASHLIRGAFFDLAKAGHALAAGGTYRASLGGNELVFRVDPAATSGAGPVVGRLLRLLPAS
jgi:hypothetical protein